MRIGVIDSAVRRCMLPVRDADTGARQRERTGEPR
jgi:hypothetical protein